MRERGTPMTAAVATGALALISQHPCHGIKCGRAAFESEVGTGWPWSSFRLSFFPFYSSSR